MNLFRKVLFETIGLVIIFASAAFADWKGEPLPQSKNQAVTSRPSAVFRAQTPLNEQQSVLQYDSGPKVFFPQQALAGSIWSVRYSPLQSCSLVAISAYSAGGRGDVEIHILSDSAGRPSQDLSTPFTVELGGDLTEQVIYPPVPVDVGKNSFHIAFELLTDGAPYITGDDDGGSGHSSYFSPGGVWTAMNVTDFAARAYVRYYGPDQIPPTLVHAPPDAAFSEDSLKINAQLSDFSGISEAVVKYSINGGDWSVLPMQAGGEVYTASLMAPEAGSTVRYFIEAKDGAALPNETFAPAMGPQAPYEIPVYAGRQIKYDDGSAEGFFIADEQFDDNRFAVRLTPERYPAEIHTLRAYVNDTARFFFSVYADSDGRPGRLLSGPWPAGLEKTERGWVNFELPAGGRPVLEAGSFFLLLQWSPTSPQQPGVGADDNLPDGRSFFYTRRSGWKSWVYNDWMLRAAYLGSKANGNLPARFSLEQNFPNPFNPATEIRFRLEKTSAIDLTVYNVLGQKVKTLASGSFPGGEYSVSWNGRDERGAALSSGVYFYRLRAENLMQTRRMILIK